MFTCKNCNCCISRTVNVAECRGCFNLFCQKCSGYVKSNKFICKECFKCNECRNIFPSSLLKLCSGYSECRLIFCPDCIESCEFCPDLFCKLCSKGNIMSCDSCNKTSCGNCVGHDVDVDIDTDSESEFESDYESDSTDYPHQCPDCFNK